MSAQNGVDVPSDEIARDAIRTMLDATMMVEAGAGSGKTTLMIDRLVAYIARGTPVDELAAVTFTRKAANELRERLESRLEREALRSDRDIEERNRMHAALVNRERLFIGTVHAFCGRILREHALDAGLPPDFTELDQRESNELRELAWHEFLERSVRDGDSALTAVRDLGIDPFSLSNAFADRDRYRDIDFPAPVMPAPAHQAVRDKLVALLERGYVLRAALDGDNRDALQQTMDRAWRGYKSHADWESAPLFARDTASLLTNSRRKITQNRWAISAVEKKVAKAYGEDVDGFVEHTLAPWFERWWAHAYASVITLLDNAGDSALQQRRRSGRLGFDDLLTETARLLRDNAPARRSLGARWRHLLVDEFQDTDPVQAEVCFLLASDPDEGNDWRRVVPRNGSLFVVGDPKQSIYRFRRADLSTYRLVEQRIALCGRVERLVRNFRSVPAVGELVNTHFASVFPNNASNEESAYQAPFAPLVAASRLAPGPASGVWYYEAGPAAKAPSHVVAEDDASRVATWIANRCNPPRNQASHELRREPQDFLILTAHKDELAQYAHQLALRNIPVSVDGAASAADTVMLELLVILRAVADPANNVLVVAALEGLTAGCSHDDLWQAREAGVEFRITHAPRAGDSPVARGLQQLHAWWLLSQRLSAAALLERVMNDSGLLLLAASDDLGDRNAGQLLQLVALLQSENVAGAGLQAAIDTIERALGDDASDATLRPGRSDVVRVMNLHKAKGLEAPVVILAAPIARKQFEIVLATWRDDRENPLGAMQVSDDTDTVVARPIDWQQRVEDESVRQQAERDRLLYVAVTRAADELVVARRTPYVSSKTLHGDEGAWAPLSPALAQHAKPIAMPIAEPSGRRKLEVSASELVARSLEAQRRLRVAATSQYQLVTVTEAAKRTVALADDDGSSLAAELVEASATDQRSLARKAGATPNVDALVFGSLVHQAIDAALRGRTGDNLNEYVKALVWHATSDLDHPARDSVTSAVQQAIAQAQSSSAWHSLTTAATAPLSELNVARIATVDGARMLSEGVIDAVVDAPDGWLVVDWKNHSGSDAHWQGLLPAYTAQAQAYLETLAARSDRGGTAHVVRIRSAAS